MTATKDRVFNKVGRVRIVPMYVKIVTIFVFFLLVSNLTANFINLMMNRHEQVRLSSELLTKELKEIYVFASNQFEIYLFEQDLEASLAALHQAGERGLRLPFSVALGIEPNAELVFGAVNGVETPPWDDQPFLDRINAAREKGTEEGEAVFSWGGRDYFGYYRFNPSWDAYIIRAEEVGAFYAESLAIFVRVSVIIVLLTFMALWIGTFLLRRILRYISVITASLMEMQKSQELGRIDLAGATNDDVTYLGVSFNSLSTTIKNLMNIFRKFVTKDVVQRAYKERTVSLEGTQKDLTILFTDIKGFTFMTETLGTDIINLLNMHYDKAIRLIQSQDGIVGSIIGDALLAVFGAVDGSESQRSLKAVRSAYSIQQVAEQLRTVMRRKREELLAKNSTLKTGEEAVFKAVLLEVGVGIDGGKVFYGRIGSYVHMTNTVIGDNVNSASRLEGLTRVYKVPIIVSDTVRQDVERESPGEFFFQELDTVQVKGKTTGQKVFWPIPSAQLMPQLKGKLEAFQDALELYYSGDWNEAKNAFTKVEYPIADVFIERILSTSNPPMGWSGIWTMTTK